MDISDLGPDCTHEEADTRIFLHTLHASNQGHSQISIRSVDTDVVVLAIAAFNKIPNLKELFIAFGTGKKFWYIPIHQITEILGPEKASSLHTMHALTGCDTTSFFRGHGKKSCWSVWFTYPELTQALSNITKSSETISEQDLHIIERYVILLYDRTSNSTDINVARRKLFSKKTLVQQLPPTRQALVEHIKRAAYQAKIWDNMLSC